MVRRIVDVSSIINVKPQKFEIKLKGKVPDKVTVTTYRDSMKLVTKCFDKLDWREQVLVFPINNNNAVLGVYKLSEGGMTHCVIDIRVLFQVLLLANATSFILAHNHPSQKMNASESDIETNRKIKKVAKIMGIYFLDHLVVTSKGVISIIHE